MPPEQSRRPAVVSGRPVLSAAEVGGSRWSAPWAGVLAAVIDRAHLATGDEISEIVDDAVAAVGMTAEVLMVNLAQQSLLSVRPLTTQRIDVDGTLAGRSFQHSESLIGTDPGGHRLLWVPSLDGTERVGVLGLTLHDDVVDDEEFRACCWSLAGLVGHVVMAKLAYSDRLRRLRCDGDLSTAAEMLWQLVPPRTFATERVVVTGLLEPWDRVAGDAYDYAIDDHVVDLAVYDGVGHDLSAGLATTLAVTGVRNARRRAQPESVDLVELATRTDDLLAERPGPVRFVTAVLARLDTRTGMLDYLVAGHPPPLLVRGGHIVKELDTVIGPPLGILPREGHRRTGLREQLEPGDRLLFYSDGIVEARDATGSFFGVERLVDFTERAELSRLSAPETLRRLAAAVLAHQGDRLQDDATLLMVDWFADSHERLLPSRI
ncbi:PP2C family protein-serine/threonine phosphatase [Actinomycetospora atypica]|uniref:PP2C family protein-serine/threonine phosphatase n=1 Tax=Actinomycetospora atypica TaxID=1290095 RepID=A0ABV9YG53_9PSEU